MVPQRSNDQKASEAEIRLSRAKRELCGRAFTCSPAPFAVSGDFRDVGRGHTTPRAGSYRRSCGGRDRTDDRRRRRSGVM
jgi:hypothetical protein